jgi:hypothetical protein
MAANSDYFGLYYFMGILFDVHENNGLLVAAVPHVPEGYEIVMEPIQNDGFLMRGGPVDGETANFIRNANGEVASILISYFEFLKVPSENVKDLQVTEFLLAPESKLTPEKLSAFSSLFQNTLNQADGGWINYDLPYPKYEFIQYVNSQNIIIFHGSNKLDIETFAPIRTSVELHDQSGRGNLQAVYGTHDGLWSMFFAVVDRVKLRGSIRNGVMLFHNRAGEALAVYNFSINQEQLPEKPWCQGALYFLPRDTFKRLNLTEHAYANEWASEQEVKPIAKLKMEPEDFPFLDRIGGHDDGELIRLEMLSKSIRESALGASLDDEIFSVTLPENMAGLDEFVKLQQAYIPAAQLTIKHSDNALILEIKSLPPAYRQTLSKEYADLLKS